MGTDLIKMELPLTKEGIKEMVSDISLNTMLSSDDIIKINVKLKCLEELIKEIKADDAMKSMHESAIEELGGSCTCLGSKIVEKTLTSYDYSECNYSKLTDAEFQLEKLQDMVDGITADIKEYKSFLQSLPGSIELDGKTVNPPTSISKKSIAITIAKK